MEQSNVVLIKLMTGDNVVCETDENSDSYIDKKFIDIYNPVLVNILRMPRGSNLIESYIMMPWMGFAKTDFCRIAVDKIITLVEVEEAMQVNYIEFMERRKKEDEEESEETSVKFLESTSETEMEIEEFLEQAIQNLGEHLEEDEEYDGREDSHFGRVRRSTRTLH